MEFADINWYFIEEIEKVDQKNLSILVKHRMHSKATWVRVPEVLMNALIQKGEQNFIESDPEHFDTQNL